MGYLDALLGLLEGLFVPVKLREDCAELEAQSDLELKFIDAHREALVLLCGILAAQVVQGGF